MSPAPKIRNGQVKYPGGSTWFYLVRFRGEIRRGDTGCTSHDAAKAWLKAERDRWGLKEQGLAPQAPPATLRQVLEAWLELRGPVVGPNHRDQMAFTIQEHFADLVPRPLLDVSLVDLERIRIELLAKPVQYIRGGRIVWERARGVGGVNNAFRMLGNVWTWGLARGFNVGSMPRVQRLKVQEVVRPIVWPELVPQFLSEVDVVPPMYNRKDPNPPEISRTRAGDQALAIRLQLLAGLREMEALGLDWAWLDWRRGVYTVGEAKSRKVREIPLAEELLVRLRVLWEAQGRPASGLVLFDPETLEAHRKGYTARTVRMAGIRIGLVGLHPHRLRATFATTLWEIGTPLVQIQLMLGHEKPETTLGYIVQRRKDQADSIRRMAAVMGLGPGTTTVPLENERPV